MSEDKIPLFIPCLGGNISRYVQECIETNYVSSVGPFVGRFENEFSSLIGVPHAVACASGTAALHVALKAAAVGPGDEVLVSDFTFIATVNPVMYVGARPILVDADFATWNVDSLLVVEELERRAAKGIPMPKAVLVAHILGLPANLAPINEACTHYGVALIEDAAEALGASYSSGPLAGRWVGTVGYIGCFSFNGNKIITTGGGGMMVTAEETLARYAKHLTTQARLPGPEYFHDEIGYNYRLTNVAAAIGVAQLEELPHFLARKKEIAAHYDAMLGGVLGVTLPPRPVWSDPSMWLYSILIDPKMTGIDRRELSQGLALKGIETRPIWAPAHLMSFYHNSPRLGGSVGEKLFDQGLSLPSSVSLTENQQARVIEELLGILNRG